MHGMPSGMPCTALGITKVKRLRKISLCRASAPATVNRRPTKINIKIEVLQYLIALRALGFDGIGELMSRHESPPVESPGTPITPRRHGGSACHFCFPAVKDQQRFSP